MGGWRKYLELQAQAKTGLSSGLFIWGLLAVVFGTHGRDYGRRTGALENVRHFN